MRFVWFGAQLNATREQALPDAPPKRGPKVLHSAPPISKNRTVHFVTGQDAVLRYSAKLVEFSECCGQTGSMHDLAYFLSKPGALPRLPYLLLVGPADLDIENPDRDDLQGAVLIFEQQIAGVGLGAFATNDRSGRSSLVARAEDRAQVAGLACRALLDRGAHVVLMSFRTGDGDGQARAIEHALGSGANGKTLARWAQRERTIPGYLPLSDTLDATLAGMGAHTRRNLRYYRRRAEAELGCVLIPRVDASTNEVLAFSRECMYPVSAAVTAWRYNSLKGLDRPICMGIKDRNGRWLSILGGRRYLDRTEILWQLNRDGLANYSLGTVMRSYFIEYEIALGARRMYTEGGTPHSMKFSFVPETLNDLVLMRRTMAAKAMQRIASLMIAKDNELSHMLSAEGLEWQHC